MLLLAVPLLTVIFITGTALLEAGEHRRLRREIEQKVEQVAEIEARVLAEPIWYVNTESLTSALDILLRDVDIVAAVGLDAEQTVLAWSLEAPDGSVRSGEGEAPGLASYRRVSQPVFFEHLGLRQQAGALEIYYSEARREELSARRRLLYVALYAVRSTA